jgi:CheY-like chemotaxis protein
MIDDGNKAGSYEILVVDDNLANLQLLVNILEGQEYRVRPATSGALALRSIAAKVPDLILLDVKMPGMGGYEVCRRLKLDERSRDIPVIFISASDEMVDKVTGFEVGGIDYITKPFMNEELLARVRIHLRLRDLTEHLEREVLNRTMELADANFKLQQDITGRKLAEENLRESEEEFRNFFENIPVSSWLEDFSGVKKHFDALRDEGISDIETYFREHPEGLDRCVQGIKIKDVNQETLDLHQAKSKKQLLQGLETTFTPESLVVFKKEMIDVWNGKTQAKYDSVVRTFNDEVRYVTVSYKITPGHEESLDKVLVTLVDITEKTLVDKQKTKLEMQLQQAQKMEAIGTLAGGIAHDFNNILAAILGYTEMARDDSPPESTIAKDLDQVLEAANRAKDLVQQILAFSRHSEVECILLQPVSVVKEAIKMLRPSLPTTIEINQNITSVTGQILADPTQIHQILMNLCTNAFHAMEDTGGKLDISLKEVTLSTEDLVHEPNVEPGTFVQLSVCDSGPGIAPNIKVKIFDPYFTTKATGKGTGMGLAIVHGIVKSCGGFISLYSEPGEGTAFHVFLPVIDKKLLPEIEDVEPIPVGRGRILFIDDEEILAEMGKSMLERLGYNVTVRNNSIEALETFQNQPDLFDLVITDQTMPGMTGADIARKMIQIKPDIPIILCTGYSTVISEEKAKSMGIKEFALKPLSKKALAVLIRKVLDNS